MAIIDAQVHAYERDHPGRPWAAQLHGPPEVTGDDMVAAMDAVGVDGALLVSPWTMYRDDASYAVAVHHAHPDRFALVAPFDFRRSDVGDRVRCLGVDPRSGRCPPGVLEAAGSRRARPWRRRRAR